MCLKDLATIHISGLPVILRCALVMSCLLSSVKTFKVKGSDMAVTGIEFDDIQGEG